MSMMFVLIRDNMCLFNEGVKQLCVCDFQLMLTCCQLVLELSIANFGADLAVISLLAQSPNLFHSTKLLNGHNKMTA